MSTRTFLAAILLAFSSSLALAQTPDLKLPSFTHLQSKAVEAVDVTIGPLPLRIASWFMDEDDPEAAATKRILQGLDMIRVRSYEFASDYEYSQKDLDNVRRQLTGKGWHRLVQVDNRNENERVDVFLAMAGDKPGGLAIVASCPREFVIVHIVGVIELENVVELQKHLGINDKRLARLDRLPR